jgi:opacity protein-like surface antigen
MNLMRKLALAAVVFALGSVAALAADFNGKWTAEVQGRRGTQTMTFDFHVDGSTLTGKVTTPRGDSDISNGKIDGDNISFDQNLNFNGNSVTIHYTGKAEGDTIHFSRQMGDRPAMQFDAKRGGETAQPAPAPQL